MVATHSLFVFPQISMTHCASFPEWIWCRWFNGWCVCVSRCGVISSCWRRWRCDDSDRNASVRSRAVVSRVSRMRRALPPVQPAAATCRRARVGHCVQYYFRSDSRSAVDHSVHPCAADGSRLIRLNVIPPWRQLREKTEQKLKLNPMNNQHYTIELMPKNLTKSAI